MDKYQIDCLIIGGGVAGLASAKFLSKEFEVSKSYKPNKADWLDGKWSGLGKYTKEAVVKDGQYQRGKTSISIEKFKGSNREIRGKIIKLLLVENEIAVKDIVKKTREDEEKIITAINGLKGDGLLKIRKNNIIEINSN